VPSRCEYDSDDDREIINTARHGITQHSITMTMTNAMYLPDIGKRKKNQIRKENVFYGFERKK
jgi:sulfite reductase beta subunit-like hemoprotein